MTTKLLSVNYTSQGSYISNWKQKFICEVKNEGRISEIVSLSLHNFTLEISEKKTFDENYSVWAMGERSVEVSYLRLSSDFQHFLHLVLPRICLKSQHTKLCWPGCWLNRFSQNSKLVIQTGYPQYPQYKRNVIHSIFHYKQTQFSFISRERLLKCNLCWIFLPGPGRIEGGIKFINIFLIS